MTRACPACGRNNAAHKAKCLYCGADLPAPAPPPTPMSARELPPDLDALVADALAGRGISRLKAALQPTGGQVGMISISAPAPSAPAPAPAAPAPEPDPEPPADLPTVLGRAQSALYAAVDLLSAGEPEGARDAVLALRAAAEEALRLLPDPAVTLPESALSEAAPAEQPEEVEQRLILPNVRFEYALFIDGPGDATRAAEVAGALSIDVATARLIAASPVARVALRGADPDVLSARAERLNGLGIRASVIRREAVLALPHPRLLLTIRADEPMRALSGGPVWLGDPEELLGASGEQHDPFTPEYIVLGEVVVVRLRARAERAKMLRQRGSGADANRLDERRLGVVDLWADGCHVRVVEGLTRVDAAEGRAPFRAFVDSLPMRYPGVRIEPRRICQPEARSGPVEAGAMIASSGWPVFEEHTRLCWLHRY